ncbi:hypothetical protein [Bradyrhizobium valentinum]|uniref:Uncharacterized protein n=1 Tax=Bradyrhizobium valentinum TaxID=1518501 RepID=A0A0R3M4R1_9BRAD|nr:hypothetical protein [Bradyrhizobium valentinum]KRR15002.1 hypothetical protein CP49_23610 [Bradyrhizobium valentinum]
MTDHRDGTINVFAKWTVQDRQFSLQKLAGGAVLTISDGRQLELTHSEWSKLGKALKKLGEGSDPKHAVNNGAKWTKEQDDQLKTRWEARIPLRGIAAEFERTQGAITARLVRLGLAVDSDDVRKKLT